MNQTYRDRLDKVIAEAENYIANGGNVADMTNKAEELNEAIKAAEENGMAYGTLQRTYEVADSILNTLEGEVNDDIMALSDYMAEIDIETILIEYPYTTEELGEIISKMDLLTQSAQHSLIGEGTNVTEFITNPSFTDGVNGWTITDFDAEKLGLSNDLLTIGEGQTGEINQTLLGMPNGVYELSVQAFQRADWNFEKMDSLWSIGKGDSLISTVSSYIFLNDGEHKIKHSFQDAFTGDEFTASWDIRQGTKSGVMMPNTESGARQYFDKGYFKNTVQAFVIDGKLTFGIRNYGDQFARWGCYDNFTLTYAVSYTHLTLPTT